MNRRLAWFGAIVAIVLFPTSITLGVQDSSTLGIQDSPSGTSQPERVTKPLQSETFDTKDIIATSGWIESTHVADWLGPLAPVALSPFFGITCLSGLALWGPDWITDNALLGASGPLKDPTMFYVFLAFTVLTSLPRLTKVSKPFAQAVDRLETYSVIVILLIVKVLSSMESANDVGTQLATVQVGVVQMGIVSFSANTLLAIVMVINVLVINSVKFFFEFLVWLTPIPALDALFEVLNKTLCAGLMAIYAFSPVLATLINLILLVCAAVVLRWISRRVRFYRTIVLEPILAALWQNFGTPKRPELIVFPKGDFGPFPAKSRLKLMHQSMTDGWVLSEAKWWGQGPSHAIATVKSATVRRGWVMHSLEICEADGTKSRFCFSRRFDRHLPTLVEQLKMSLEADSAQKRPVLAELAGEFR